MKFCKGDWKNGASRKKKSNRRGKVCAQFRALRKRGRRINRKT